MIQMMSVSYDMNFTAHSSLHAALRPAVFCLHKLAVKDVMAVPFTGGAREL